MSLFCVNYSVAQLKLLGLLNLISYNFSFHIKSRNEPKLVIPKSEDLNRSLEINAIWTFDTEFPTIFNKSWTYITFKSAVKHRQLGYGYPRGQTVHLAEATT